MTARRVIPGTMQDAKTEKVSPFECQPKHVQEASVYQVRLQMQRNHVWSLMFGVAIGALLLAAPLGLAVRVFGWAVGG